MFNPKILAVSVLSSLAALFLSPVVADSKGSFLWDPTVNNEINTYARVIELQHAGDKNGRLLATWEHTYTAGPGTRKTNGTAGEFIIRKSEDGGKYWSTLTAVHDTKGDPKYPYTRFEQPFFFEFPRKIGKYLEGTLLLVGNLVPSNGSTTNFFAWRSEDHGETWDAVGEWQHGGPSRSGIWEPFLYMDNKGRLVAVFSDERQSRTHSQMLVNVISEDGGDTWGDVVKAVASTRVKDRPGMATVAEMGNGEYIMSYEFCGHHPHCPVHIKTSKDGVSWDANDTGIGIDTADGIHPVHSPYTIWDPSMKQVVLSSHYTLLNSNNQDAPENSRSVFINKHYGRGEWFWAPSPWTVPNGTQYYCKANYSPDLLSLSNGVVRYTAPAGQDNSSFCSERTGQAPIGALPYTANFTAYGQAGWIDFGGKWKVSGEEYGFESVGSKDAIAMTGSSGWTDYKTAGDVIIKSSSGSIGLNVRMSASDTGLNKLKGYAVAIDSASGKLITYRHANSKLVVHSGAHPGGIQGNKWYHLSVVVKSDEFTVTLAGEQGSKTTYTVTDGSFKQGMAGLFGNNGGGSFKNIQITN